MTGLQKGRQEWAIIAVLAISTIAVFWRVHRHEFVNYDDYVYVTLNPMVQPGFTWEGIKWAFRELHGEATYWHPLTWLSHMMDCQLFGLRPGGHHVMNLLLHTANVVLLFTLVRRMTGRIGASAVVATLFALHPLQVDSVAWVAERKNVLSTLFWLLSLLAYVRYAARPGWMRYLPVFVFMALGLMAKPMLVTLPFVLLLLDFWPLGRLQLTSATQGADADKPRSSTARLILEKLPLLALSAASSLITFWGHQGLGAIVQGAQLPFRLRLENAMVAYALYLRKLVWPVDLSVFYLHPGRWPTAAVVGSALLLLVITTVALRQFRRRPYLLVGWLWFLGTLVPTIGLIQANTQALADRFAYVPVIGIFLLVVWTLTDLTEHALQPKPIQIGLAGLALAGCVVMTSLQLGHWRNSVTLLQHTVKLAPENTLARAMLGNAWVERGNLDEALAEFTAIIRSRRDDANGWLRVGMVLTEQRKPAQAIPYYQNAIQLAPGWPEPRRRLALALLSMGRKDDARTVYMTLPELMPNTADGHRDLADMFAEGQQPAEAVQHYNEALRLKPEFPVVLNNLAFLRATCAQPEWRDGRQAVQLAERVCQESGNKNPEFLSTLAAAYAEAERFGEAVKWIQKAQAVAKASGATNSLLRYSQMLEQFQTGKPFRVNAPQ